LAAGVLLAFSDADAQPVRVGALFGATYDAFARYWAFNHVLFGESPRYAPGRRAFACVPPRRPGDRPPEGREEAFPALWERAPERLLELVRVSACAPVHAFAARALRACPAFLAGLAAEELAVLIAARYPESALLGLELVRARGGPGQDLDDPAAVTLLVAL